MTPETNNEQESYNPEDIPKLSIGLNILTILTFIWSAYEIYRTITDFLGGQAALEKLQQSQEKLASAPAWAKKMVGPEAQAMMTKAIDNKVPLLIIGLVAIALCVYGAIEMRKLKKQGYTLWLIGEILPILGSVIFLPEFFSTVYIWFLIFPLLFILLYTLQRKNLKY